MGGDSLVASGSELLPVDGRKVFIRGPYLIGAVGPCRFRQIMRFTAALPEPEEGCIFEFMATKFTEAVRSAARSAGHATNEQGRESMNGCALVGVRGGRLFLLNSDFTIHEAEAGYVAIGGGRAHALAVLYDRADFAPKVRIERALKAAQFLGSTVREPFYFESIR
jgi:hypothetical protein